MRCATARKRLSDALDGALPPGGKRRLEAHLKTCPACRACREGLDRIQAGSRLAAGRSPESWAVFERNVDAKLAAAAAGRRRVNVPFAASRRWAWGAAAAMLLAVIAAWYGLLRPWSASTDVWAAADDVLEPLIFAADASPEAAGRVDLEVRALIDDLVQVPDTDAAVLPAADPLFWEGLSDDDLRAIVTELEAESGLGGPQ